MKLIALESMKVATRNKTPPRSPPKVPSASVPVESGKMEHANFMGLMSKLHEAAAISTASPEGVSAEEVRNGLAAIVH